ncbi:MAG: phosphate transport system protein [Pseudohongiellaceae bacterium]|jgi:phosphate transport system protein
MKTHLHRDLEELSENILAMGAQVESALELASKALVGRRVKIAEQVLADDVEIDAKELKIDDDCLKILALHQPVAGDLRQVTAAMKINNDLERIGDLAVNMAERAIDLAGREPINRELQFKQMTAAARWMLRASLQALVTSDVSLAREVCARDDEVDDINRLHFEMLIEHMGNHSDDVAVCLDYLTASLHLERVADLATNIAQDVIFLVEAVDVRHGNDLREQDG